MSLALCHFNRIEEKAGSNNANRLVYVQPIPVIIGLSICSPLGILRLTNFMGMPQKRRSTKIFFVFSMYFVGDSPVRSDFISSLTTSRRITTIKWRLGLRKIMWTHLQTNICFLAQPNWMPLRAASKVCFGGQWFCQTSKPGFSHSGVLRWRNKNKRKAIILREQNKIKVVWRGTRLAWRSSSLCRVT